MGGLLISAGDEEPITVAALTAETRELHRTTERARKHLRVDDALEPARFWAGIRTHAEDQRFLIGPDPDVAGLVWAGALGGHGITCAEPVGRIAAEWVVDGASAHGLAAALNPDRQRMCAAPSR